MADLPELLMISHLPLLKAVYAFVIMPAVCVNYKIIIIIAHNTTAQSREEDKAEHSTLYRVIINKLFVELNKIQMFDELYKLKMFKTDYAKPK